VIPVSPEPIAVVGLAPDHAVGYWSTAAERLTGRTRAEVIGRPVPFPVPALGAAARHRLPSGTEIEITAFATHEGAAVDGLVLREHLPPAAEDDSTDLFLAAIGHELRTPVTVIRGYADTLVEHWDVLDEEARREAIGVVRLRAQELSRLVDRSLTVLSGAAGLVDGAPGVPFDLVAALREVTAYLAPELRTAVRLDLPATLPKALGDRGALVTVLTELVTNACKHSPPRVTLDVTAGADPSTVWFKVSDRGVGIRPEHVERAFRRFWQAQDEDQRRYGGVGLGLYLVRRIVERQHGSVSLQPREGGGTVAEVRLPRADTAVAEEGA
jgi:signal transduction histidine kinase